MAAFLDRVGTTTGEVLVNDMPIMLRSEAIIA